MLENVVLLTVEVFELVSEVEDLLEDFQVLALLIRKLVCRKQVAVVLGRMRCVDFTARDRLS